MLGSGIFKKDKPLRNAGLGYSLKTFSVYFDRPVWRGGSAFSSLFFIATAAYVLPIWPGVFVLL
jgi:hypothetical protein